jgi:hypothetical protein
MALPGLAGVLHTTTALYAIAAMLCPQKVSFGFGLVKYNAWPSPFRTMLLLLHTFLCMPMTSGIPWNGTMATPLLSGLQEVQSFITNISTPEFRHEVRTRIQNHAAQRPYLAVGWSSDDHFPRLPGFSQLGTPLAHPSTCREQAP